MDDKHLLDAGEGRSRASGRGTEMDFADASLYWLAHETGVVRVMTTGVRDFSRYRLPDGRSFEIL